ncbi:MAG: M48 family metalloprotease [Deltaproteobacteria bacterium]|nr:M48 family metalloprotease [Deltaproteobacteria bacterium]MBW2394641.1 M48 family metalloprotease [Deltaproteobacteria bacterium]
MKPRIVLILFLAMFCGAGCLSPARETAIGDQEAEKVEKSMGLVADPIALAYVRRVGERLSAVSSRPEGPWSFKIADSEEPNAFALPGGHVYVTRGLLALINSEDELAGVIGHEIGHVTARHSAKQVGAAVLTAPVTLASAIVGLAVGLVSPLLRDVVEGTGQLFTKGLVLAPFGRVQENRADEIGQTLASLAGYDPAGLPRFLHTLGRDIERMGVDESHFHFLNDHPMTEDRVAKTRERAETLTRGEGTPLAATAAELFAKLDGLLVGADPAQGVFRKSLFLHPGLDLAIDFPEGWETVNTADAAGAVNPEKDAVVALRLVAEDTTLDAALQNAVKEQKGVVFERSKIRGLPAARTRHVSGGQTADITLIGFRGDVFAIVGQSSKKDAKGYEAIFEKTGRSFRALRKSERESIRESRLRVRSARSQETATSLATRTGSTWSAKELAVANGVEFDAHFSRGQAVKVAVPEPYSR